jgi:2-hydroxy-3-oxopropionate reductase
MLDYVFEPGFKTKLHHKDMHIVQESAAALGITLPGATQTTHYLDTLMAQGDGELDSSAMLKVLEQIAGVSLKSTDNPTDIPTYIQEPS